MFEVWFEGLTFHFKTRKNLHGSDTGNTKATCTCCTAESKEHVSHLVAAAVGLVCTVRAGLSRDCENASPQEGLRLLVLLQLVLLHHVRCIFSSKS